MIDLVRQSEDGWYVVPPAGASAELVTALASGRPWPDGLRGSWTGTPPPPDLSERVIDVDQTQHSVVVGEAVVVKWTVTPTVSASPATALTAHLAAVGFSAQPTPLGSLSLDTPDAAITLASVTSFLPGAVDGWDWYVDDVRAHARGTDVDVLGAASDLGRLVAELHIALATPSESIPSPREKASKTSIEAWHARALASLDEAIALTDGPEGDRLKALAPQAITAIDALLEIEATPIQPIHGDLHVGQVLRWPGGYAVNDFDGNPVLAAAERLAKQPVARDVAGMLQSLDHVGRVALRHADDADPIKVSTWIRESRQRFLRTYRLTLAARDNSELLDERLLTGFAVEQECREYVYAARHLPRWLYVPDAALPTLLN